MKSQMSIVLILALGKDFKSEGYHLIILIGIPKEF